MSVKDYNPYIAGRVRASRNAVTPLNIYAIARYKDRHDEVSSRAGDKSSLVFVLGIHEGNLNCIKLNEISPDTFFKWAKKLQKNRKVNLGDIQELNDVFKNFNKNGKAIFEGYVKRDKNIYTPKTYRMYRINGIQSISRVKLIPEVFQNYFNATID